MGKIVLSDSSNPDYLKFQPSQLVGDAKWKDIEDLINRWARRNPRGAKELEAAIQESRANLQLSGNKTGKWQQGYSGKHGHIDPETKIGISIHPELMSYIQAFYPKFMDTKEELHEFMYRFPKFTIPEKI